MKKTLSNTARNRLRRQRYAENLEKERESSRLRGRRIAAARTPEEHKIYLERHRAAQAKYRASCRKLLVNKQQEYRKRVQHEKALEENLREMKEFEAQLKARGEL